jgi:hypothetical protein
MRTFNLSVIVLLLLFTLPLTAQALIYKYVDDNGRMIFVDDADKIPPQYRDQIDSISEERDTMTTEEYEAREEERAQRTVDLELEERAREEAQLQEKRRAYQTPVMIQGNRIMVPVEVAMGNRVAHLFLLLDTGATATVLHRQSLMNLELPQGEKVQATIAGGRTLASEKIKFKYIEIGPFREKSIPAMVIDPQGPHQSFDGMLGMDFLKAHTHRIDYDNEMVIWDIQ